MIDAISISGTTPSIQSRSVALQNLAASEAPSRANFSESFFSTRIRVDNFLDLAIIEIRSSETGDVIRQFPTEKQIEAFKRADELQQRNKTYSDNNTDYSKATDIGNNAISLDTGYDGSNSSYQATSSVDTGADTAYSGAGIASNSTSASSTPINSVVI